MFRTRITELFGIEHPIIGGTMMHLSGAEFVATICEAGALGILASAMFEDRESFRQELRKLKDFTDRPFGVNLNLFPAMRPIDNLEYVDVILEEGVPVVETSGHQAPEELVPRLRAGGVKLIHKCAALRHARKAASLGVDAVTVVGFECGGHIGQLDVTTLCLVPRVVDGLDIPVIGGGGVADGRGLLAVLSLGAEGVIVGTRLLLTEECPIHPHLKRALLEATELDTILILRSLRNTVRVWKNATAEKVVELEARGAGLAEIYPVVAGQQSKRMFAEGDLDGGILACSQSIGLVREIKPVKEVIADMVRQAEEIQARLEICREPHPVILCRRL